MLHIFKIVLNKKKNYQKCHIGVIPHLQILLKRNKLLGKVVVRNILMDVIIKIYLFLSIKKYAKKEKKLNVNITHAKTHKYRSISSGNYDNLFTEKFDWIEN